MPAPLPPVVTGPIYAVPNVQVLVDGVLPDALVKVLQNGAEVGHATSTGVGKLWVPTTVSLVATHHITATQTYNGGLSYVPATPGVASEASPVSVPVWEVPKILPVPIFLSGVSQCSSAVELGGLIPGATVTITQDGNTLGSGKAEYPSQWFNLTGPEPSPNQPLEAIQAFHDDKSHIGLSALVAPKPDSLPEPVAATPILACQTYLDLSDMTPGATVEVTNNGAAETATSPSEAYTGYLPALQAPSLTVQQYFTRCQQPPRSPVASYEVSSAAPPRPKVGYALCASLHQLTVTGVLPGEVLNVSSVTEASGGGVGSVTALGPVGVSSTSATVYLPSLPAGTVALRVSVGLCGRESPYVTVPVSTSTAKIDPPRLQAPLYNCAHEVVVTDAHPGCLLTVFSGTISNVIANPVVATAPLVVIPLWTALVTGEKVAVEQTGCHAEGQSGTVTVIAPPAQPAVPVIAKPVLSDATSVTVSGVLPGAQVFLYVRGVFRSQVTALGSVTSLPVGAPALTTEDFLEVTQQICGKVSVRSDAGPGYAKVQAPAPQPSGGLTGNSGYFFQNSCGKLLDVTVQIQVNEEIGGSGASYTGFGFQLNCWSLGLTDVNAWQQFAIIIDPSGTASPSILALANSWPYNWNGSINDFTLDSGQTLAPLSTASLPAPYQFSIQLTTESPSGKVTSAVFSAVDNEGNPHSQTITLTGLADNQGGTITDQQLAPIVAFQLLLVGPDGGSPTALTTGAGTMTISADGDFIATNTLPSGCTFFDSSGTAEDSNINYGELPASPSHTFLQTFSV